MSGRDVKIISVNPAFLREHPAYVGQMLDSHFGGGDTFGVVLIGPLEDCRRFEEIHLWHFAPGEELGRD